MLSVIYAVSFTLIVEGRPFTLSVAYAVSFTVIV
jgi:hypothetical protein